jgi:hypothetical protein
MVKIIRRYWASGLTGLIIIALFLAAAILVNFLVVHIFMWVWSFTMVPWFDMPQLSFWAGFVLLTIVEIIS